MFRRAPVAALALCLAACAHAPTRAEVLSAASRTLLDIDAEFSVWHASECARAEADLDEARLDAAEDARARWVLLSASVVVAIRSVEAGGDVAEVARALEDAVRFLSAVGAR